MLEKKYNYPRCFSGNTYTFLELHTKKYKEISDNWFYRLKRNVSIYDFNK